MSRLFIGPAIALRPFVLQTNRNKEKAMNKKLALSVLIAAIGFGCSKNSTTSDPIENVRQATKEEALQVKTFRSECQEKPINELVTGLMTGFGASMKSQRVQFRFEGANVHRQTWMYSTRDCSGQEALIFDEGGEIKIHDGQTLADGSTAIDFDYRNVDVQVVSAAGAEIANSVKLCSGADWKSGDIRSVNANSEDWNCYSAQVPRQEFNVYRLDGNVLLLGTDLQDNSADKRPTGVDQSIHYSAE
jgi:hypothetical protein